ncbi:HAD family hydrolase [Pontibacter cellulosilyticus]|uniref:HAD family phosphatase n=1 Tax=Pontibacter cellulosilyticus TaxID=1720253 RepID=A0A923N5B9_9BACT|nr:HAD family phosphatase [Pontibacter cellulosilyticus]MBC5992434.1 HAD family phosphatase [Pontibacter cellulosilyticus]
MDLTKIKNIIFDLGGVIINIDYNKSIQELQKLCKDDCQVQYSQKEQSHLFDLFETGTSSPEEFRRDLRETYQMRDVTDQQIDNAWNAMLLDIPQERIDLLRELAKKYRIFLLSNTNAIHLEAFNKIVEHSFSIPNLDSLFEEAYYSHLVGKRKPDEAIFKLILDNHDLAKEETLFIDDSKQHIDSAQAVGIHTLHLQPPLTINKFFANGAV